MRKVAFSVFFILIGIFLYLAFLYLFEGCLKSFILIESLGFIGMIAAILSLGKRRKESKYKLVGSKS